jgi:hypothetical protein
MAHKQQLSLFGDRPGPSQAGGGRSPSTATLSVADAPAELADTSPPPRAEPAAAKVPRSRQLQRALEQALGPHQLKITDNRSTLLSTSTRKGVLCVRVHQLFLDGDEQLFLDIARYLRSGHKGAGERIDAFVASRDHLLDHHVKDLAPDAHVGEHHDLLAIFRDLNASYFHPAIRADITWSAASPLKRKSSITLGTYDARARRIQIHPALDQSWVPRLCVARVVHHEMLHAKHPAEKGPGGRRVVHGPAFLKEEAGFDGAQQADVWFDLNLDRLLRYRPPIRRRKGSR